MFSQRSSPLRRLVVIAVCLLAAVGWAGKEKVITFKTAPTTVPGLTTMLKNAKDANARVIASLVLDTQLREKGIPVPVADADQPVGDVLGAVFNAMVADTATFSWDKDSFGPRADILCTDKVLVFPSNVSAGFSRKYTVTVKGKRADKARLNTECTLEVAAAKSEDEWHEWTSQKGWGIAVHKPMSAEGVTRVGLTFFAPGNASFPAPRRERPAWVGFKKDAELFLEPPISADYRKQESNVFPVTEVKESKTEPEKKLRVAIWMEALKVLNPNRPFIGTEKGLFGIEGVGGDEISSSTQALLEPYRLAEWPPIVRASAELKSTRFSLGNSAIVAATPSVLLELLSAVRHPSARAEVLKELVRQLEPGFANGVAPLDADKKALTALVNTDPKKPADIKEIKIYEDWAKVKLKNTAYEGWLFKQSPAGWQILGQILK